jgi:TetR/AcrR family transcriptional regulator
VKALSIPRTAPEAFRLPPASPKRGRNSDQTKLLLLNAAEVEFAAKGFDGARLQNIARAVGVQQALIHHYFDDKDGLYRAVIERGMAAVTAGSWDILERLGPLHAKRGKSNVDIRAHVTSFVDLVVDFYAAHTTLLAILRHDAENASPAGHPADLPELRPLLATHFRPVLDAVVAVVQELQRAGKVRADVDPRHLCVSLMAMACLPFQEAQMISVLWPDADFRDPVMISARKAEIVETVLGRVLTQP